MKNVGLASVVIAGSVLTGCNSMPSAGEGKERYMVGAPRHPAMMAIQAGNYEIDRVRSLDGREIFEITGNHWAFGERGKCEVELPQGAENVGYGVTQGILNNTFSVGYDLIDQNGQRQRFVRKYQVGMGARQAELKDEFPVIWDGRRERWMKEE